MTDDANGIGAAVAAGVLAAENDFAELLRSIVEVARAIFGAQASSILLFDEATDELVFAAVAGEGEQRLVGRRMPSTPASRAGCCRRERRWCSRTSERPALRTRRRREDRLRARRPDGRAVAGRRAGARGVAGARPAPALALLPAGDGAARPLREPGRDRARSARLDPARTGRARRGRRDLRRRSARGVDRRGSRATGAPPASRCSSSSSCC